MDFRNHYPEGRNSFAGAFFRCRTWKEFQEECAKFRTWQQPESFDLCPPIGREELVDDGYGRSHFEWTPE